MNEEKTKPNKAQTKIKFCHIKVIEMYGLLAYPDIILCLLSLFLTVSFTLLLPPPLLTHLLLPFLSLLPYDSIAFLNGNNGKYNVLYSYS